MHPDELKRLWQTQASQARLTIDADLLLKEVRRNQQAFTAIIVGRDIREVGTALFMIPVWFYLGAKLSLPWTWYLTVPVLLWIAGFMLVDRKRHHRDAPEPSAPLREHVEISLAQVEHQIWLLRNVFWWYLLPPSLSLMAFFAQVSWHTGARAGGSRWVSAFVMAVLCSVVAIMYAGVYWLNQKAVRTYLEPRRQELLAVRASLQEETPAANESSQDA